MSDDKTQAQGADASKVVEALTEAKALIYHLAPNPTSWGGDVDRKAAAAAKIDAALASMLPPAAPADGLRKDLDRAVKLHPEIVQMTREEAIAEERERWESAIGAVMPPDFKQWRDSPVERPATAAWCIANAREQADQAWAQLKSAAGWLRAINEAMVTHHAGVAEAGDTYEAAKAKLDALLAIAQDIGAYHERDRIKAALLGMDDAVAGRHNYYAHAACVLFERW